MVIILLTSYFEQCMLLAAMRFNLLCQILSTEENAEPEADVPTLVIPTHPRVRCTRPAFVDTSPSCEIQVRHDILLTQSPRETSTHNIELYITHISCT